MKRERIRVVYSIISSRIDHAELAERPFQRLRDHGHADPGAARLPRAAAPAIPPRTRVAAPYRSCSACARPREQQRASGKRRALRTTSWPWFVLARAPPRNLQRRSRQRSCGSTRARLVFADGSFHLPEVAAAAPAALRSRSDCFFLRAKIASVCCSVYMRWVGARF